MGKLQFHAEFAHYWIQEYFQLPILNLALCIFYFFIGFRPNSKGEATAPSAVLELLKETRRGFSFNSSRPVSS
jgi:hypothetical protein